jgi:hypothetical protein
MTPVARKRMKGFDGVGIHQMIPNESAKKVIITTPAQ